MMRRDIICRRLLLFAAQLPYPDLGNYSSATTPLFHILFALLLRAGCSLTSWAYNSRFPSRRCSSSSLICAMGRMIAAIALQRSAPLRHIHIRDRSFGTAHHRQPGAGKRDWSLYLLDRSQSVSPRAFAGAVLLALIAVLTRQLYLWLVPALFAHAVMNREWSSSLKRAAIAESLLPLISVSPLFLLWHGLANSHFAPQHELHTTIVNGKALVLALCILGAFAMLFAFPMRRVLLADARLRTRALITFRLGGRALAGTRRARRFLSGSDGRRMAARAREHTPTIFHIWSLFWISSRSDAWCSSRWPIAR